MGNSPNFAQASNGNMLSVVSRDFGRGAKAGALVELFYPSYGKDNLWDAYVGVRARGDFHWAHDMKLVGQRVLPDTGIIESDFSAPGIEVRVSDVVRPGHDAHVRQVTVTNRGVDALDETELSFFAFYTIGGLPGGDKIRMDASGALVQSEPNGDRTVIATMAERAPSASHCGAALLGFTSQRDARFAAEDGRPAGCSAAGPVPSGVTGALFHKLPRIAPGKSESLSYAIGLGQSEAEALGTAKAAAKAGFAAAADEDRARWAQKLAQAKPLPGLPARAKPVYNRALITVLQHRVNNGAFIAAPTLTSPAYRYVWPRDGSKSAVDLLEAGYAAEAKQFFEFLEQQLLGDGSFAVNYFPDGSGPMWNFGREGNENDQPGMLPWGVSKVYEVTNDQTWLRARYAGVRKAADFLVTVSPSGFVGPSRDLWELETGASWTYANGSAIAGLEAAARIAQALGEAGDATRYAGRAAQMRATLQSKFVTPEGYFARGLKKNGKLDARLEIGNLALGAGGFGILQDTTPALAGVGDLVASRLLTPGGAVRRYDNDRYYGGQPWPVASNWLSVHKFARGDKDGARALFSIITEQAYSTDSLMLGEQFDEGEKKWLSAFPLAWSEAAYVVTARAIYGGAH
jgi:GH15 family glucan-1,4-alpha-glucosidase